MIERSGEIPRKPSEQTLKLLHVHEDISEIHVPVTHLEKGLLDTIAGSFGQETDVWATKVVLDGARAISEHLGVNPDDPTAPQQIKAIADTERAAWKSRYLPPSPGNTP